MSSYVEQRQNDEMETRPQSLSWADWLTSNKGTICLVLLVILLACGYYWWSTKKTSSGSMTDASPSLTDSELVPTGGSGITITRMKGGYY